MINRRLSPLLLTRLKIIVILCWLLVPIVFFLKSLLIRHLTPLGRLIKLFFLSLLVKLLQNLVLKLPVFTLGIVIQVLTIRTLLKTLWLRPWFLRWALLTLFNSRYGSEPFIDRGILFPFSQSCPLLLEYDFAEGISRLEMSHHIQHTQFVNKSLFGHKYFKKLSQLGKSQLEPLLLKRLLQLLLFSWLVLQIIE